MSVIVAYVPTPEGRAALDFGIKAARDRGDSVKVADGSGGRHHIDGADGQLPFDRVDELLRDAGVAYEILEPAPSGVNLDQVAGAAVDDPDNDIIVIGVRHRTPMGKFLLGSSAQRLILDAECPVIAVKARPQS